jgi:serine/threonine-protein kinase RsbW
MLAIRQALCSQEAAQPDRWPEAWYRRTFRTADEVPALLDELGTVLEEFNYPKKHQFAVRLALEEAMVNAVKHGNRGDPNKKAQLRYLVDPGSLLVEVEDEGAGFDPAAVPDPLAPENLERPSGRGLFLIRRYMTWMEHNKRGNCVRMCKQHSQ